jgi:hypothetical protein
VHSLIRHWRWIRTLRCVGLGLREATALLPSLFERSLVDQTHFFREMNHLLACAKK